MYAHFVMNINKENDENISIRIFTFLLLYFFSPKVLFNVNKL